MTTLPASVARFLEAERIAVLGVSRDPRQPANHLFRRLRDTGHEVVAVNPATPEVEGGPCYPALAAVPGAIHAVVVATPPAAAASVVRECAALGVDRVWFHRSFGEGSVSEEALRECRALGIEPIVGGCPMMFCEPVDLFHRCSRWWLARRGRVPR